MKNEQQLRRTLDQLGHSYRDFMGFLSLKNQSIELTYWKLVGFAEHTGFEEYEEEYLQWSAKQKDKYAAGADNFLYLYLILSQHYQLVVKYRRQVQPETLEEAQGYLALFKQIEEIKMACAGMDWQKQGQAIPAIATITNPGEGQEEHFLLDLYFLLYQALSGELKADFNSLLQQLAQYQDQLDPRELTSMLDFALNHCIRQVNTGQREYEEDLSLILGLYPSKIKTQDGLKNGRKVEWVSLNQVVFLFREKRFEDAQNFLRRHKEDFGKDKKSRSWDYCQGLVAYGLQEWDKAKKHLAEVYNYEKVRIRHALHACVMMVQIYEETTGDGEAIWTWLGHLRKMAKSKKAAKERGNEAFLDFYRYTKAYFEVVEAKSKHFERELVRLGTKVAENPHFPGKKWITERIQKSIPMK